MPASSPQISAFKELMKYGVGAAIAVYLVWELSENYNKKLDAQTSLLATHVGEQRAMRALLYRICVNTAGSERETSLCTADEDRPHRSRAEP